MTQSSNIIHFENEEIDKNKELLLNPEVLFESINNNEKAIFSSSKKIILPQIDEVVEESKDIKSKN